MTNRDMEEFLDGIEEFIQAETAETLDLATVVTLNTAGGSGEAFYLATDGTKPLIQLITENQLDPAPSTTFWNDNTQVELTDVLQPGTMIYAIGAVKGG